MGVLKLKPQGGPMTIIQGDPFKMSHLTKFDE